VNVDPRYLAAFLALPIDRRMRLEPWLDELPKISRPIQASLAALAERLRVSRATARRRYDTWRLGGTEALIAEAGPRMPACSLPAEFIEYWNRLCQACQGNGRRAWLCLVGGWRLGARIPGYGVPPGPRTDLPAGWSYGNLMRHRASPLNP